MTDTEEKKAPPKVQLSPRGLQLTQHSRTEYHVTVNIGVTLKDVAKPEFWEHHAKRLRPADIIEMNCEDMTWAARLLVRHKSGNAVLVGVMSAVKFVSEDKAEVAPEEPKYIIGWQVGPRKHKVRLNEPGSEWIGDGHDTKEEAQNWITQQEKALER